MKMKVKQQIIDQNDITLHPKTDKVLVKVRII